MRLKQAAVIWLFLKPTYVEDWNSSPASEKWFYLFIYLPFYLGVTDYRIT